MFFFFYPRSLSSCCHKRFFLVFFPCAYLKSFFGTDLNKEIKLFFFKFCFLCVKWTTTFCTAAKADIRGEGEFITTIQEVKCDAGKLCRYFGMSVKQFKGLRRQLAASLQRERTLLQLWCDVIPHPTLFRLVFRLQHKVKVKNVTVAFFTLRTFAAGVRERYCHTRWSSRQTQWLGGSLVLSVAPLAVVKARHLRGVGVSMWWRPLADLPPPVLCGDATCQDDVYVVSCGTLKGRPWDVWSGGAADGPPSLRHQRQPRVEDRPVTPPPLLSKIQLNFVRFGFLLLLCIN